MTSHTHKHTHTPIQYQCLLILTVSQLTHGACVSDFGMVMPRLKNDAG